MKGTTAQTVLYLERNMDGTIGGSYRSLLYLVKLLPKERWRPIVVFYRDHHLVDEFHKAGCRVIILQYPRRISLIEGTGRLARIGPLRAAILVVQKAINFVRGSLVLFLSYLALLLREHVELVHLNNGVMSGTELLLASRLGRARTIVHQRGIGALPSSFRRIKRLIDHAICVSDAARTNLIAHGLPPSRCTTVHNGIDPDEFRASITRSPQTVRKSLGIPDDAVVVGNAGMLKEWKGQLVLVKAINQLRGDHPRAHCLIVGGTSDQHGQDAAYRQRILRYVEDHGLSRCVQILDYQRNVAEFIQVFDIMVHTSVDPEPFSRSVLEGMTLGRAMVATRTGGTPEAIVDGVSGVLVAPNDHEELAQRLDVLLRKPELRADLGRRAQERIRERFLIARNVESTIDIYGRVMGRNGGGGR